MAQLVTQSVEEVALTSGFPTSLVTQSVQEIALSAETPLIHIHQVHAMVVVAVNGMTARQTETYLPAWEFGQGMALWSPGQSDISGQDGASFDPEFGSGAAAPAIFVQAQHGFSSAAASGGGRIELLLQFISSQEGFHSAAAFGQGMVDRSIFRQDLPYVPLSVEWLSGPTLLSGWDGDGARKTAPFDGAVMYFGQGEQRHSFLLRSTAWRRGTDEIIDDIRIEASCDDPDVARMVLRQWPESGHGVWLRFEPDGQWILLREGEQASAGARRITPSDPLRLEVRISTPPGLSGVLRAAVRLSAVWRSS